MAAPLSVTDGASGVPAAMPVDRGAPAGKGPARGAAARPPSKITLPFSVVIAPLLVVRPVIRVWSFRTLSVAPARLEEVADDLRRAV